jgi:hypothetical protein
MTNDGQVDVFLLKYIYFDVISVRILDIHESFKADFWVSLSADYFFLFFLNNRLFDLFLWLFSDLSGLFIFLKIVA